VLALAAGCWREAPPPQAASPGEPAGSAAAPAPVYLQPAGAGPWGARPPASDGDRDFDGVLDIYDKCPSAPEDLDGFQDEDGCPEPDNDSDGILDVDDMCPSNPEDRDGFQDEDGCPDP